MAAPVKISDLPVADPITGAELVPIVQGGVTKKSTATAGVAGTIGTVLLGWAYNQTFQLVSATRDTNGAVTTAAIKWPDGITGTFTTDTASVTFPGAIDAWHATYLGSTTKTVTQSAVTRDANGAVTVQPAITIS